VTGKRQPWVTAGLRLVFTLSLAGAIAEGQAGLGDPIGPTNPATSKTKTTEETYKNIQVLKGLPADQLIPAMQFMTYSLGVECSFCHTEGTPEKDDKKPKQAARKMMQMMFAINQQNFEGKRVVTCYSCHRGSSRPLATPVVAEIGTQIVTAQAQDEDEQGTLPPGIPQADQIFAKYVDALGGAGAIEQLSTRVEKGAINLSGRQFPVDILSKAPGKRATVIHLPNGDNITAYDGSSGWTSAPDHHVHDIPSSEAVSAQAETDLQLPIRAKQLFSELRVGKPEKIDDRDVYVISGLRAGLLAAKFYFDERSGLLLRLLRYADSPLGRNPTQIDYADYREPGSLKVPFQRTIARPNSRFTIQIAEVHDNVTVEDAEFARPAAQPSSTPPSYKRFFPSMSSKGD
jgi:photosynthetic reaction center cytochrome c subunit